MSTPEDLAETVKEVEALDRRIVATQADVRDFAALKAALDDGVAQLGRLDIVSANAGIFSFGTLEEMDDTTWQDMLDVNLTGVWHAAKAAIPHLRRGRRRVDHPDQFHGRAEGDPEHRALQLGQARRGRADAHAGAGAGPGHDPGQQRAPHRGQHRHDPELRHLRAVRAGPARSGADQGRLAPRFEGLNALPIPWVEPVDISNAVLWLASDEARYVTGVTLPIDAGLLIK